MADRASIADLADETGADPKSIRHFLRSEFKRADDSKGSRWGTAKEGYSLTKAQTAAVRERFTPSDEAETA